MGHGTVNLLDLDEEYIATFPSAFGRSILTVPWVELGGKVNIQCPKTGYVANIEFKCKPFFSSEVNKVRGQTELIRFRAIFMADLTVVVC
jgi:oxysterol-binding protein-related protein 9/10/11